MSGDTDKTRRTREQALDYIRNNPDGVRTRDIENVVAQSYGGLVYQLERLQSQGLIWRNKVGKDGRWFPVASGKKPPIRPLSETKTRQFNKILALVDSQGYITISEAAKVMGLNSTSMAAQVLREMAERGVHVLGDAPTHTRANKSWTRPPVVETAAPVEVSDHRNQAKLPQSHAVSWPHTRLEALAARRITATYALPQALEEMTDPDSESSLNEVADRLTMALDKPLRAQIAADLEERAGQEEGAGNLGTAQVLREIGLWITRTVTSLGESL